MALVALNLERMTVPQLIVFAEKVHSGMTANAVQFPDPTVPMADFRTHIDTLIAKQELATDRGKMNIFNRDQALEIIRGDLRKLGAYVQNISLGDETMILAAGMNAKRKGPRRYDTLTVPENLRLKNRNQGTVELRWKPIHNAKSYAVEHCTDPITAEGWQNGAYNSGARSVVMGLEQLKKHWFRVRALGSEGMKSDWSDPAAILVL